jgi:hypothetical protein
MNEQNSLELGKILGSDGQLDPEDTPELSGTKASKYREMVKHGIREWRIGYF